MHGLKSMNATGRCMWRDCHMVLLALWHSLSATLVTMWDMEKKDGILQEPGSRRQNGSREGHLHNVRSSGNGRHTQGEFSLSAKSKADLESFQCFLRGFQADTNQKENLRFWSQWWEVATAYVAQYLAIRCSLQHLRGAVVHHLAPLFFAYRRYKYEDLISRCITDRRSNVATSLAGPDEVG